MSKFISFLLAFACAGILTVTALWWSVANHENAHVKINGYFGVDSYADVYFDMEGIHGRTHVTERYSSGEDRDNAYIGHAINEAVGYQFKPFFVCLLFIVSLTCFNSMFNSLGDYYGG